MCRRLCQLKTPFENFLVRFSDPKYFLSVHHFWVLADDRHFLGPIFGPKIVLSVPHFWVLADDGYFLRQWHLFHIDNNIYTLSEFDWKSHFL